MAQKPLISMHSTRSLSGYLGKIFALLLPATLIIVAAACGGGTSPTQTATPATGTPTESPTGTPISTPTLTKTPTISPTATGTPFQGSDYVVLSWNDLGMHCLNPTYDQAVILPPYNTVWAQVIKRGNPPQIVTSGLTAEYRILDNTYSYGKRSYGQFWDNAQKLFGASLARDTGLNLKDPNLHNSLSGTMANVGDHFEVVGIPITPITDSSQWNPYQVAEITVRDSSGRIVAQTHATVPTSDEMSCNKCHSSNYFQDILQKHDNRNNTTLLNQEPVLCASCHGDPALGAPLSGQTRYLSDAMHSFHSTVSPQPACYDCHPGPTTQCSRSIAHTASDGNCTNCHDSLAQVGNSINSGQRTPWANEPKCVTCHGGVAQVDTQTTLYRNAAGHGGVYCAACHSSPHAMVPTSQASDNYQAIQYQGKALPIGDCGACHAGSRGGGDGGNNIGDFAEEHAGSNGRATACNVCHTSVNTNTNAWPHEFQWKARAS